MKLVIKSFSWSNWMRDCVPEETENEYEIKLGKYVIKKGNVSYVENGKHVTREEEYFSFEILEINESSIKIHTFQKFFDYKPVYTIEIGKPIVLSTPTRDAVDRYTLSLIK